MRRDGESAYSVNVPFRWRGADSPRSMLFLAQQDRGGRDGAVFCARVNPQHVSS